MNRSKLILLARLARLDKPTGYFLSFFPASYGLLLKSNFSKSYGYLILFFIGSILTRSAGCIINDICDRKFDRFVERTKDRPLAAGSLTLKEALIALITLLLLSLGILLSLPFIAIKLGVVAFILILLYPLMKRVTNLAQLFLGFTFNFGALIGYATINFNITLEAIILYLSCCFWTLGYDTIYAFMDLKDDKRIGLKGTAVYLENKNYKLWFYFFYFTFISLFSFALHIARSELGTNQIMGILLGLALLFWQVKTLDITSDKSCMSRFKANNYVGLLLFLSCLR